MAQLEDTDSGSTSCCSAGRWVLLLAALALVVIAMWLTFFKFWHTLGRHQPRSACSVILTYLNGYALLLLCYLLVQRLGQQLLPGCAYCSGGSWRAILFTEMLNGLAKFSYRGLFALINVWLLDVQYAWTGPRAEGSESNVRPGLQEDDGEHDGHDD